MLHSTDAALDLPALDVEGALRRPVDGDLGVGPRPSVAMLPWIAHDAGWLEPRVDLLVVDAAGRPLDGVRVAGHFTGASSGGFTCLAEAGRCAASGPAVRGDADSAVQWRVTVGRVGEGSTARVPGAALLLSDALLDGMELVADAPETGPLGVVLAPGAFPGAVEAVTFGSVESGRVGAPVATVFTPAFLDATGAALVEEPGGSGLATSPMGMRRVERDEEMRDGRSPDSQPRTVDGSSASGGPLAPWMLAWADPGACVSGADCPLQLWLPDAAEAGDPVARLTDGDLEVLSTLAPVADPGPLLPLLELVPRLHQAL